MATMIAPGGSVCEVEGKALIASLEADGWTVQGEKSKRQPSDGKSEK